LGLSVASSVGNLATYIAPVERDEQFEGPLTMASNRFSEKVSFIWTVADLLRGDFRESEYHKFILPFTLIRCLDQALADTRMKVLETASRYASSPKSSRHQMLLRASSRTFYNTSGLSFTGLRGDSDNVASNLTNYVSGFSRNVRDILDHLRFDLQVERLDKANLLRRVHGEFAKLDFDPTRSGMGEIFDEVVQWCAEETTETAGEHFTPPDVQRLMAALLFAGDDKALSDTTEGRTVYDPACGTGGLFSAVEKHVHRIAPDKRLDVLGQELNAEAYAICAARLLVRGLDPSGVELGNSLSEDGHSNALADYVISHPPFGLAWSEAEDAVRSEHQQKGYAGRFGPGLPRRSDGSLLFLLHMLGKMKPVEQGGCRLAVVTAGPPLFAGAAGSGESEIRRWIIENDWLEAIVVVPTGLYYNTAIPTFIWLVSNRKAPHRKGKVRLINGTDYYGGLHRPTDSKRREFTDDNIQALIDLLGTSDDHPDLLVVRNEDLGHVRLSLGRPLRLNFQATGKRIARLEHEQYWRKLSKTKKEEDQDRRDRTGQALQEAVLAVLDAIGTTKTYKSRPEFLKLLKAEAKALGVKIPVPLQKGILNALSERDETAEVCTRGGETEYDPDFRRVVEVPLRSNVEEYIERRIRPELGDAVILGSQVGFAVKRVAHLGFGLRRELDGLRHQYEGCQLLPLEQACTSIDKRKQPVERTTPDVGKPPLESVRSLRALRIETDEDVLLPDYLAMFLSTDIGQRLLDQLLSGSALRRIEPDDLGQLEVPVPTLDQQRALLATKAKIDELGLLLGRIEDELAANPANIDDVQEAVAPILRALGRVSEADEIRELIRGGESKRVEFKESFSLDIRKQTKERYIEDSTLKNVVAFLNSEGGDLVVGVADDGEITGVEPELLKFYKSTADKLLLHVKNQIKNRIGEQYYPLLQQRIVTVGRATILRIHCDASTDPVFLDGESFFVRTNPATDKLVGRKQHEYIKRRFG
jgi:type I restriction enzyme M protein